jgi:hypothetical protein
MEFEMRDGDPIQALQVIYRFAFNELLEADFRPNPLCLERKVGSKCGRPGSLEIEISRRIPAEKHHMDLFAESAVNRDRKGRHFTALFELWKVVAPAQHENQLLRILQAYRAGKHYIAFAHVKVTAFQRRRLILSDVPLLARDQKRPAGRLKIQHLLHRCRSSARA